MFSGLFDNTTVPVLQEVASFAQARHHVLAGNIANADTPGYHVRDLSVDTFRQRLRDLIAARRDGRQEVQSPGQTRASQEGDAMRKVRESLKSIQLLDGSDVGIEQQITEVAKNQQLHNLTLSIMTSQFRLLQTAVSERV